MRPPAGIREAAGADSLREELRRKGAHFAAKRLLDIVVSLGMLFALAPLLVAIAIGVRLSSPGPILFKQKRVGHGNTQFWFYKFRSMRMNSSQEKQTADLEKAGVLFKNQNDPRVTWLGRFLRKWSLDEFPQLLNILKGEMSLVGPRPLVPFMLEPYPEFKEIRGLVRPGLTGLWQIRDRANNTSAQYMMAHDTEYIKTLSFWGDLKILWMTIFAVASGRGAV